MGASEEPLLNLRGRHGAAVYSAVCVGWVATLLVLVWRLGYPEAAYTVGVPAGISPFGDMRIVLDGIDAGIRGVDVLRTDYTPRDYFPIRFPYHRSWLAFGTLGVTSADVSWLSILLGLAVVAHMGVLTAATGNRTFTGLVAATFVGSPPVLLGFERGNPDLFVYLLLAAAVHLLAHRSVAAHTAGLGTLFAAGMLKFAPFAGALAVIARPPARQARWRLLALIVAAAAFLAIEKEEVTRIAASPLAQSQTGWASFGAGASVALFSRVVERVTGTPAADGVLDIVRWCGVAAVLAVGWSLARRLRRDGASLDDPGGPGETGFAIGAGIFVASFMLINSYNYKFMFLGLAIPALCHWASASSTPGRAARLALASLMVWVWSGLNGYVYLAMNIALPWVCVTCLGALLGAWAGRRAGIGGWSPAGVANT